MEFFLHANTGLTARNNEWLHSESANEKTASFELQ